MAFHIDLGKKGEQMAESFLVNKGFTILHRNWRHSRYEIDLIVLKNGLLHFIEVKCRTIAQYGYPEESVSRKKIKFLMQAAEQYLFTHPEHKDFRLDVLSITINPGKEPEIVMIEDVYL